MNPDHLPQLIITSFRYRALNQREKDLTQSILTESDPEFICISDRPPTGSKKVLQKYYVFMLILFNE